jgi:predicted RNA binding protein YcfA (HicA-like mRNA interferase family)
MSVDSKSVLRSLQDAGWIVVRQKGSHVHLKHPSRPEIVTVPHPRKEIAGGTLAQIARKSGLPLKRKS